ncbi:hypothetical protein UFOVP447_230 [uncultured Caudovirales phage]|uniref:Uncharacterized protein n=1 Tax=uncultured Caudovirales phage TaxID=2100421 RepID=A0A6J5MFC8_9CAUD|nr:hypothetical protein UFOVP447_230 [uncultured Caudovirales phage]
MRHPRQREMWEGLTGWGCLGLIGFVGVLTFILEILSNG